MVGDSSSVNDYVCTYCLFLRSFYRNSFHLFRHAAVPLSKLRYAYKNHATNLLVSKFYILLTVHHVVILGK